MLTVYVLPPSMCGPKIPYLQSHVDPLGVTLIMTLTFCQRYYHEVVQVTRAMLLSVLIHELDIL